jgi:hypothetical protein
MDRLLTTIIDQTFMKEVGKFQAKNPTEMDRAMHVRFSVPIDTEKEEGYRYLDLAIYAPMNYVQVWTRDAWNVIPLDELAYEDDDGEAFVIAGSPGYREGASVWKLLADHDSCWRDGVRSLLQQHRNKLSSFSGAKWFTVVPVTSLQLPGA